jgi:hypothetical protein
METHSQLADDGALVFKGVIPDDMYKKIRTHAEKHPSFREVSGFFEWIDPELKVAYYVDTTRAATGRSAVAKYERGKRWVHFERTEVKPGTGDKWFDTDTGAKRTLFQDDQRILYQDGDGSVRSVENGPPPETGSGRANVELPPNTQEIGVEGWRNYTRPVMRAMRDHLADQVTQPRPDQAVNLDANTARMYNQWLAQAKGNMSDAKLLSMKMAEMRRDAALLNYGRRRGFDHVLGFIFPYQFWYTRSAFNWMLHSVDRPSWLANYARIRDKQRNMIQQPGFPTRLRDKVKIPMPFLPEWAGDGVYVDPLRQLFPFEQFAQPYEQYAEEQHLIARRAESILAMMAHEEEVDAQEVQSALDSKSGPLWEKAVTMARMEVDSETGSAFDLMGIMLGYSLPISYGSKMYANEAEKIGPLPSTRLIRSATSALGLNQGKGWNVEGPIRRALGMPEWDEFEDFRIDRMLANMVAEGLITPDDAKVAMIERSGPLYDEASTRSMKMKTWSAGLPGFSADFFPEGEQEQRALSVEYSKAIEARGKGDNQALSKFFEKYPEYEARMASLKDPDERLKQFMVGELWDRWHAMSDLHKRELSDFLGEQFQQQFLEKETRNYDSIDTTTLGYWAVAMGARTPGQEIPEGMPMPKFSDPQLAQTFQDYRDGKKQFGDGLDRALDMYYKIPSGPARDNYAAKHPEIEQYNRWRNTYLAQHPEIIPHAIGEQNRVHGAKPEVQALYYQYQMQRDQRFPGVFSLQDAYFKLPDSRQKAAFRQQYPMLPAYWDWRREFMRQYPQMIPYLMSEEAIAEQVLGGVSQAQQQPYQPPAMQIDPVLERQLVGSYYGQALSAGATRMIADMWSASGAEGSLEEFTKQMARQVVEGGY